MKDAIDRYKDAADKNLIRVEVGSEGYPPDLETLVAGVNVGTGTDKKDSVFACGPDRPDDDQKDWGKRCVSTIPIRRAGAARTCSMFIPNSRETGTDGRPYSEW